MIIKILFSISLHLTGGHLVDTKLGLHHYSDKAYEEIFYLKKINTISKYCIRHSELEDIQKKYRYHNNQRNTVYKVNKNKKNNLLKKMSRTS